LGLRIIGGDLKGKKLHSVRGPLIRPTADRLRESIFDILFLRVQGAIVLDLFAGSGALGIEALSRGAASAVFIDKHQSALSVIERNIRSCVFDDRTKIIQWNILKNLNCIKLTRPAFDLVFMDPPYHRDSIKPALFNLHRSGSLAKEACIIIEHTPSEPVPKDYVEFEIVDQRRYGKTIISFLNYMV